MTAPDAASRFGTPDVLRAAIFLCALAASFLPMVDVTMFSQRSAVRFEGIILLIYVSVPAFAFLALIAPSVQPLRRHVQLLDVVTVCLTGLAIVGLLYVMAAVFFSAMFGTMLSMPFAPFAIGVVEAAGIDAPVDSDTLYGESSLGVSVAAGGWLVIASFVLALIKPLLPPAATA